MKRKKGAILKWDSVVFGAEKGRNANKTRIGFE
jgi:hypothetical protein